MGATYFYFKNSEAPHFSISDRMYRYISLCLNDAQGAVKRKPKVDSVNKIYSACLFGKIGQHGY